MSTFRVTPATVAAGSAPLATISGAVQELHGGSYAHATAAGGTPAAAAVEGLMGRWSRVLPEFALASERLAAAVGAAAADYELTDAVIGAACDGQA
jgi:hypothetical protein